MCNFKNLISHGFVKNAGHSTCEHQANHFAHCNADLNQCYEKTSMQKAVTSRITCNGNVIYVLFIRMRRDGRGEFQPNVVEIEIESERNDNELVQSLLTSTFNALLWDSSIFKAFLISSNFYAFTPRTISSKCVFAITIDQLRDISFICRAICLARHKKWSFSLHRSGVEDEIASVEMLNY